jgi:hypothetical protein
LLTAPYSKEELRKLFSKWNTTRLGPDGFPVEFYPNFWEVIKLDLLELFSSLHCGQLELFHLNFGKIILLRKVNEAERIQQYQPIYLLNVSFKIFTKVATIRLNRWLTM